MRTDDGGSAEDAPSDEQDDLEGWIEELFGLAGAPEASRSGRTDSNVRWSTCDIAPASVTVMRGVEDSGILYVCCDFVVGSHLLREGDDVVYTTNTKGDLTQ